MDVALLLTKKIETKHLLIYGLMSLSSDYTLKIEFELALYLLSRARLKVCIPLKEKKKNFNVSMCKLFQNSDFIFNNTCHI